jgi:hypothetical protein
VAGGPAVQENGELCLPCRLGLGSGPQLWQG